MFIKIDLKKKYFFSDCHMKENKNVLTNQAIFLFTSTYKVIIPLGLDHSLVLTRDENPERKKLKYVQKV